MKAKEYPSLVEQVYYHATLSGKGGGMTKQFIFDQLKKQGLLDKFGQPTPKAIKSGAVKETKSPIEKFKANNPSLIDIPDSDFNVNDRGDVEFKLPAARKYAKNMHKKLMQAERKLESL